MQKVDILKKDYERYFFPLPVSRVWGLRKKKYVFSELEKRHPCFSDEYAFDVIIKPGRKGVFSDVVVIKKITLAECRKKITGLRLEDCREKRFGRIDERKCFFGVLFALVLLGLCVGNISRYREISDIGEEETSFIREENQVSTQKENNNAFLEKFFLAIKNEKGTVTDFFWKTNASCQEFSVSLKSIYPEKLGSLIEDSRISPILYVDGEPNFTYSKQMKIAAEELYGNEPKINQFQVDTRKIIVENACKITEETFVPYAVKFSYEKITDTEKKTGFEVFLKLKGLFEELGISVESIILKIPELNEGIKYEAELSVNSQTSYERGIDISILSRYSDVFFPDRNTGHQKKAVVKREVSIEKETEAYEKLGEVKHEDGTKLIFYKDQNGKLKTRKVES